ncbi:alpha/beta fold hydrolase [Cochleicola gelatinilyticus]|nr:alpha/beta hydrolase [Cochleicola gelatinilyticus]
MKKMIPRLAGAYFTTTAYLFPRINQEQMFRQLCKVKPMAISSEGNKFLDTAKTKFIAVEENKVAVHTWGNGPKKIVFLHGWMSYSYRWKIYIDSLDLTQFTVYSVDAPAHGRSEGKFLNIEKYRQAAAAVISEIGPVETLVCHSLGSLVGAYMYLNDPKIPIQNYVIMGAPSGMDAIFVYFKEALPLGKRAFANLLHKVNTVLKIPSSELTMQSFFEKIEKPVLVVHDRQDGITKFEPIERLIPKKKNIKTFFTDGQGHNLIGKDTIETITDFIKQPNTELVCM